MRLYVLFKAPPSKVLEWDHKGIVGQHRWLVRLWNLVHRYVELYQEQGANEPSTTVHFPELEKELRSSISSTTDALLDSRSFNVAIASLMKLSNVLGKVMEEPQAGSSALVQQSIQNLLVMLAPLAPFISEELWHTLARLGPLSEGQTASSVHDQAWPLVSKQKQQKARKIVVQMGGKTKGAFPLPEDVPMEEEAIRQFVEQHTPCSKPLSRKTISRTIFLPDAGVINFLFDQ